MSIRYTVLYSFIVHCAVVRTYYRKVVFIKHPVIFFGPPSFPPFMGDGDALRERAKVGKVELDKKEGGEEEK